MKSKISVIMSVYNTREKWLKEAIESILNQTYSDFEFVVVLDCPTDNSKEIVEDYQRKDERIVIIENKNNIGIAESLNVALKNCRYEYVARMDSDDISEIDRLEKQLRYLTENNYDLIGSSMSHINEQSELLHINSAINDNKRINEGLLYENVVPHPTWFVKKSVYDNLKGYRNFSYIEDYDFLLRCLKHNYRIGYINENLLRYRYLSKEYVDDVLAGQYLAGAYLSENIDRIDSITKDELYDYLDRHKYSNKQFWIAIASSSAVASCLYRKKYLSALIEYFRERGFKAPSLTYKMTRRKYKYIKLNN